MLSFIEGGGSIRVSNLDHTRVISTRDRPVQQVDVDTAVQTDLRRGDASAAGGLGLPTGDSEPRLPIL